MFFLERLNRRYKRTIHGISPDVLEALNRYDYPGNVRELENIISRSFATAAGDRIELIDLPEDIRHSLEGSSPSEMSRTLNMKEGVENLEREYISRALDACGGKKNQAAEQLGISRRILYYKMEKYGIPLD